MSSGPDEPPALTPAPTPINAACETKQLCQPVKQRRTFENPFKTWHFPSLSDILSIMFRERNHSNIPKKEILSETLPVEEPNFEKLNNSEKDKVQCTWIGHASCLVQMEGINLLTDPIFSQRCAPVQFAGPKRYRPPALTVSTLPEIHAVVISHTHYDHLDYGSVKDLHKRFGDTIHWFVPKGLKSWMNSVGCQNVYGNFFYGT